MYWKLLGRVVLGGVVALFSVPATAVFEKEAPGDSVRDPARPGMRPAAEPGLRVVARPTVEPSEARSEGRTMRPDAPPRGDGTGGPMQPDAPEPPRGRPGQLRPGAIDETDIPDLLPDPRGQRPGHNDLIDPGQMLQLDGPELDDLASRPGELRPEAAGRRHERH